LSKAAKSSSLLAVCPRGAHAASDGLIWPRVGFASITFPQRRSIDFLPLRKRIPRETRKSPAHHPPLRYGRKRCALIALGLLIAIEAAMGAARVQTRRVIMATIGSFTKSDNGDLGYVNSKCPLCRAIVIELGHT
jgi:membrane associated rhomboid family serine protease